MQSCVWVEGGRLTTLLVLEFVFQLNLLKIYIYGAVRYESAAATNLLDSQS